MMKLLKEFGRNANVDWTAILVVSFVLLCVLAGGGFALYNAVVEGSIKGADTSTSAALPKLNEKPIEKVIVQFSKKKEVSDMTRSGYRGISDPSM